MIDKVADTRYQQFKMITVASPSIMTLRYDKKKRKQFGGRFVMHYDNRSVFLYPLWVKYIWNALDPLLCKFVDVVISVTVNINPVRREMFYMSRLRDILFAC